VEGPARNFPAAAIKKWFGLVQISVAESADSGLRAKLLCDRRFHALAAIE
jgi:hypothetical protein